jgi:hypothetical protein
VETGDRADQHLQGGAQVSLASPEEPPDLDCSRSSRSPRSARANHPTALAECVVTLKNENLKAWTQKELNGFQMNDDLPEYRRAMLHSKGNFMSEFGNGWMPNRPLPLNVLEEKDRQRLRETKFPGPIATYDTRGSTTEDQNAMIVWPPDIIAKYQTKYIDGFILSHAWQDVPATMMVGLCEEVRNRVLTFALEIRDELGLVGDKADEVSPARVEAAVVNHIYGGTNVIGNAREVTQIGINVVIPEGDFKALANALSGLQVPKSQITELEQAIAADKGSLGGKTKGWLKGIGSKLGGSGLKVGTAAVQELAKEWLLQFFGLK